MRAIVAETWLLAAFVLAWLGFASGSTALVLIGAMIFGAGGLSRLWARLSLDRVTYRRTLSDRRVFVGEEVRLELRVDNAKVVPVPWLEVRETLPRGMPASVRTVIGGGAGTQYLTRSTSMAGNDHLEWPLTLRAVRRGFFRVGPTRLRSGDLFGFFERQAEVGRPTDGIVVYPHTYALSDLGFDSTRPFGDLRGGNRIYEDPSRVAGVRDYQPGDPMRRIDWYATARVGRLQSRIYEPSRSQALVIALNIPTDEEVWRSPNPVLLERAVSLGASVARWAADANYAVGLIANGSFPDAPRTIRIGAGNSPQQLNLILEALAVVTAFTTIEMSRALEDPAQPLPPGSTIVLITALMTEPVEAALRRLASEGHRVHVLKTAHGEWSRNLDPIPVQEMAEVMETLEREAIEAGLIADPEAGEGQS
ncbi:MAG: DUF58 domain-containing protein [Dehalococcoidia bacterium]|nr:DUF58 domain-containing protein [Dehalococcoidia bacterium]